MLRPAALAATDYAAALRPLQGYERRLKVSLGNAYVMGELTLHGLNSGTWTAAAAEAASLAADPHEIVFVLDTPADAGEGGSIVVTVTGTDQNDAALSTKTATISVPAYSTLTRASFPRGYGAEVQVTEGKYWKTITSVTVTCPASCANVRLKCVAIPALSTFSLVGCRANLDLTVKVQKPFPIQCGIDLGAYVKPGEITVGNLSVSAKILNGAEGLNRINGRRVVGMIQDLKEETLDVGHTFLTGLIISGDESAGEGQEPAMFQAQGLFEQSVTLLAG